MGGASLLIVGAAVRAEWQRYVYRHPAASGYHDWAWRNVFEQGFDQRTEYLCALRGHDVVGVLPLVVFRSLLFGRYASSLPFVNYGGVLADDEDAAAALLEAATAFAQQHRLSHLELRHSATRFPTLPAKRHKVHMHFALGDDPERMWNELDRKVRNQVRRADKSDLVRVVGRHELLPEFYDVFSRNMRDLGTPVYGRRVFESILSELPGSTEIHLVRHGGRAVAGAVTYVHNGMFEIPWASSLRESRPLCPNYLLYWEAIKDAVGRRCHTFDFGRSTPGEGTFHFKSQWGAVAQPVCWEYRLLGRDTLPDASPGNPRFKAAIAVWKRLPLRVSTVLGPPIVRQIA